MVHVRIIGEWRPGEIRAEWALSTLAVPPEGQRVVEHEWAAASARLGAKLFDGPMCRLEAIDARPGELRLSLSRTSYRVFFGTNLTHAELAERFGPGCLANPVGLSAAMETADGLLVMGRRNESVAYYPDCIHPFAGAMEPGGNDPPDLFDEMRRELLEELRVAPADLLDLRCIGMIEDVSIRQPEFVFYVRTGLSSQDLARQLDQLEHHGMWFLPAEPARVASELRQASLFTPVAVGTLLLWGRVRFGQGWYDRAHEFVG